MNRGLFLDLGDTLVRVEDDEIYMDGAGEIEFLPHTVAVLQERGPQFDGVFVVTNQSGIAKGTLSLARSASFIDQVNRAVGGLITDFWACPHLQSPYRKPNPGMLVGLADKHFIDLGTSVMVGDSSGDQQAAQSAGIGEFVWAHVFFGRS